MILSQSIPDDKKLRLIYRVEPGCLGPNGDDEVAGFCRFVQQQLQSLDAAYVCWQIEPRDDKALPEMEYGVVGKKISRDQAERYLASFDKCLDDFESHLIEKLTVLIATFMRH